MRYDTLVNNYLKSCSRKELIQLIKELYEEIDEKDDLIYKLQKSNRLLFHKKVIKDLEKATKQQNGIRQNTI